MILVTGATGRIGGELVKNLVASGEQVRAMVRNPTRADTIQGLGVETVVGDLERPETLDAALRGVERAFLISGDNPQIAELHGNFVEAARRADVGHIVRTSILVAMMPDSPLATRFLTSSPQFLHLDPFLKGHSKSGLFLSAKLSLSTLSISLKPVNM